MPFPEKVTCLHVLWSEEQLVQAARLEAHLQKVELAAQNTSGPFLSKDFKSEGLPIVTTHGTASGLQQIHQHIGNVADDKGCRFEAKHMLLSRSQQIDADN